jgi:poly(A) polymerase
MPVPDTTPLGPSQRKAATALLRRAAAPAAELGRIFARHGYELALVGGPVRDVFLGRPHSDLDLATDALPQRVLEITRDWADTVWETGIDFGTVGLRKGGTTFEITTYRSESYARDSRRPAKVEYGTSLEEDLRRRDFTVNAMAARLPSLELVDPFGGLQDLRHKVLRTPGEPAESFNDDALRIMRAARFAAQLGFTVAPEVAAAMRELAPRLGVVSAERIRDELIKLLQAPGPRDPGRGITLLVDTGVADVVLPEVPRLRLETDEHMRHKDVYQHSLTVLEQAIGLEERYGLPHPDLVLRLAALLHDIGKPKTRSVLPGGRVAFHHHDTLGAAMARSRLKALRFPSAVVAEVSTLIAMHLRFHGDLGEWTDSAVRRYVRDAGPLLPRLHALTRADCTTRNKAKAARLARAQDSLEQRIATLSTQEELKKIRPDLDGHEIMSILGLAPGREVGRAYNYLLDLRMEHGPLGKQRATQELLRWAGAEGLGTPSASPGRSRPASQ